MPTVEAIAPDFLVADLSRSVEWYARVLGFQAEWQAEDHAGVRRGAALILLSAARDGAGRQGVCHLRVEGVDDLVAEIEASRWSLITPARDRPEYGMREAALRDPDGNVIYIAQRL